MKTPKKLIKDVTFDFDKEETKCGPHIAYTLPIQGGAASGLNNSFLFKAEDVGEEVYKAIEELGLGEVKKDFGLIENKKRLIEDAVRKQFADDDEWLWLMDMNDTTVYFCGCKGVYAVGYTYDTSTGEVMLDKLAEKAIQLNMFTVKEGKMKLSEQAEDDIEEGLLVIMEKALEAGENFEEIEVLKTLVEDFSHVDKTTATVDKSTEEKDSDTVLESNVNVPHPDTGINKNKEDKMDIQELLKSEEFTKFLSDREAEIQKAADERIKKAEEKAEAIEKAAKEEKLSRLEKGFTKAVEGLSFVKEEDREELVKGLVESHDVSVVIKMLNMLEAAQEEITKTKEQFATTEHGQDGEVDLEKSTGDVDELLKSLEAKYSDKEYL